MTSLYSSQVIVDIVLEAEAALSKSSLETCRDTRQRTHTALRQSRLEHTCVRAKTDRRRTDGRADGIRH